MKISKRGLRIAGKRIDLSRRWSPYVSFYRAYDLSDVVRNNWLMRGTIPMPLHHSRVVQKLKISLTEQ